MKKFLPLFLLLSASAAFCADSATFPGLKTVMTPEEFARSGLDHLSPDQLGVIDAAIIRHYSTTVNTVVAEKVAEVRQANAEEKQQGWLSRFGLPQWDDDWRTAPPLKARCTGWAGGNSFKLDNGQVWEGIETIPFELQGKDIEIQARPGGLFALSVEGRNTTIRVHRVK